MALDLGGTNFRVLKVTLGPGNKFSMVKEKYAFPEEMKVGTGEKVSVSSSTSFISLNTENKNKPVENIIP